MSRPLSVKIGGRTKYLYKNEYHSVSHIESDNGLKAGTVRKRIKSAKKAGRSADVSELLYESDSFKYYVDGVGGSLSHWEKVSGIYAQTLHARIGRGMTMKQAIAKKVRVYADSDLKANELTTPADAPVLILVWNNLIQSMSEQEAFKRIRSYV